MSHLDLAQRYENKIKSICKPVFDNTEIHYFGYNRVYKRGLSVGLYSDVDLVRKTLKANLGIPYFDQEGSLLKAGAYFAADIPFLLNGKIEQTQIEQYFSTVKQIDQTEIVTYDKSFIIIFQQGLFDEVFFFSCTLEISKVRSYFTNLLSSLYEFCCYFVDQASCIIEEAQNSKLSYPLLKTKNSENLSDDSDWKSKITPHRFRFVTKYGEVFLSKQEFKCLEFAANGLPNKEIAAKLDLKVKTIENYIEKIKNKLTCEKRSDIISLFKNSIFYKK